MPPSLARPTPGPRLLEREAELAELAGALDAAADGRGTVLAVEGQAGIGKSRLLAAARALAAERGLDVLAARGSELERSLAFGAVRQLLEARVVGDDGDLLSGAARLAAPVFDPEAIGAADDEALTRLHGLYWLVANLAARGPLLLAVDDVHWIDEASLRVLRYLAPRVADLPVCVVLATRPPGDPTGSPSVEALLADPDVALLRPAPLSERAVAEIVADEVDAAADPGFVRACVEATAGNPFLVRELLAEVAEQGLSARERAADEVRQLGPAGIVARLLGRLGRVSPAATRLVRALAILGDGTTVRDAGAFAGIEEAEAVDAARVLESTGLVVADDGLRFVHPIVRQAVYRDLTAVERGERHADAAAFVAERGAGPEAVAAHLLHAPPAGDAARLGPLRAAARRAEGAGDQRAAADYLLRALREPPPAAALPGLLADLGRAEVLAGDPQGIEHLERCLALEPPADVHVAAAEALASILVFAGQPDRGADVLEEALRRAADDPAATRRVRAHLATVANVGIPARRRLLPVLATFEDPGRPARDDEDVQALAVLAFTAVFDENDGDRAADLALRALAAPLHPGADAVTSSARVITGVALMYAEEHAAGDAHLTALLEDARRAGALARATGFLSVRALLRWHRGWPAAAETDALAALELLPDAHGAEMLANAALGAAVLSGVELDRPRAALDALLAGAERWLDPLLLPYSQVLLGRGAMRLASGDPAGALEAFLACDVDAPGWGRDNPSSVPWRSRAALALAALGRDAEAQAMAAEEVALSRAFGRPRSLGVSLRAAAIVGPADERLAGLEEAVAALRRADVPAELARALVDQGALLRREGARDAARSALDEAHGLAERVGAARVMGAARAELRALGARPRATAGAGLPALTVAERRVAELAAGGRTNREIAQALFVSEKTVETHLARIFRKLDVRSRRQLPDLVPGAS